MTEGLANESVRFNLSILRNLICKIHRDFSKPSRRTGLAADAKPGKGSEWRGIWGNVVISENLPHRTGLSANAGPGTGCEWTPGGRGWEAEAGELGGRRQKRSACSTIGLLGYGRGCFPRTLVLQHQKLGKKNNALLRSVCESLDFGCQGMDLGRFSEGSRRSPTCFL